MYKYRFFLTYILLSLCFLNCEEKATTSSQEGNATHVPLDTISLPKLSGLKPTLGLTQDAQEVTDNWKFYQDVSKILDSLGSGNLGQTRTYVSQLNKLYKNLEESGEASLDFTPDGLLTQPIKARLAALETQIKVLNNAVSKNEPSTEQIAASIVKSKNAFQDLNLQIDERFALSIEEMLAAANESPDSLLTAKDQESALLNLKQN